MYAVNAVPAALILFLSPAACSVSDLASMRFKLRSSHLSGEESKLEARFFGRLPYILQPVLSAIIEALLLRPLRSGEAVPQVM
jgi:hypothetical protein